MISHKHFAQVKKLCSFIQFCQDKFLAVHLDILFLGYAIGCNHFSTWQVFVFFVLAYQLLITALGCTGWLIEGFVQQNIFTEMLHDMKNKKMPQKVHELMDASDGAAREFITEHNKVFGDKDRLKKLKRIGFLEILETIAWSFSLFPWGKQIMPMSLPWWVQMVHGYMLIRAASKLRQTIHIFARDAWAQTQYDEVVKVTNTFAEIRQQPQ